MNNRTEEAVLTAYHHYNSKAKNSDLSCWKDTAKDLWIATNITVQFDDGCEVKHKIYKNFKDGIIKHPFPYTVGTITMQKPAYVYNREGNFYCKCSKCGLSDIMSLKEIKEHKHKGSK